MKKILKIVSMISIILFGILWVLTKFTEPSAYNTMDIRNILVVVYLVTSLRYYQMQIKEKNTQIGELKTRLAAQ